MEVGLGNLVDPDLWGHVRYGQDWLGELGETEELRARHRARVEEMRAKVVEAEAEVPRAMAEAFRQGNLGIMDYYRMKNLQADTDMRGTIAGADDVYSTGGAQAIAALAYGTETIERALDTLSPDLREAFLMKHVEELSYEEMTEMTGVGSASWRQDSGAGSRRFPSGPTATCAGACACGAASPGRSLARTGPKARPR